MKKKLTCLLLLFPIAAMSMETRQEGDSIYRDLYGEAIFGSKEPSDNSKTNVFTKAKHQLLKAQIREISPSVAQIDVRSGFSPNGSKTYTIPIECYQYEEIPSASVSLAYDSQRGNGTVGVGWYISGISAITRGNRTIYFDNETDAPKMNLTDAFFLDGMRLVKTGEGGDSIIYALEQDRNIKVVAHTSMQIIKHFDVYYPDGRHARFGDSVNSMNLLCYPMSETTDARGNIIFYEYVANTLPSILCKISYGNASIDFEYDNTREDIIESYRSGVHLYEDKILKKIICKYKDQILRTYTLIYNNRNGYSVLTALNLTGTDGLGVNPLLFEYGTDSSSNSFQEIQSSLSFNYRQNNLTDLSVVKGRFNYNSGKDGVITYPCKNPYVYVMHKEYHDKGYFPVLQKQYNSTDTIIVNNSVGDYLSNHVCIQAGEGFVQMLCADIDGTKNDYAIKINNKPSFGRDQIIFEGYKNSIYGIGKAFTRTFSHNTVRRQPNSTIEEIQPKYFFSGDFNGDGKTEILAISVYHKTINALPSRCFVFDLANGRELYNDTLFRYEPLVLSEIAGVGKWAVYRYSYAPTNILVADFNGDGKSDICYIGERSTQVYTFEKNGTKLKAKKIGSYNGLTWNSIKDKRLVSGDFNGDGLTDLLVTPILDSDSDKTWYRFISAGNGQFSKSVISGVRLQSNTTVFSQDFNDDGRDDIIIGTSSIFTCYGFSKNGLCQLASKSLPHSNALVIPASIHRANQTSQLSTVYGSSITNYYWNNDSRKELLLTKMTNSFGVVEKNSYYLAGYNSAPSATYANVSSSLYPYLTLLEPLTLLASSETYSGETLVEKNKYQWVDGIFHMQGRGFCGFRHIVLENLRGRTTTMTFDPQNYGVLKNFSSPSLTSSYDYTFNVKSNKAAHVLLKSKTETNLLTNREKTTTISYNTYGLPVSIKERFAGDISIEKTCRYHTNTSGNGVYHVGIPAETTIQTKRGNDVFTKSVELSGLNNKLQPQSIITYINGASAVKDDYTYDTKGRIITKSTRLYQSATPLTVEYTYNEDGLETSITDETGQTTELEYDECGRISDIKDCLGGITHFQYDRLGRERFVSHPDGSTTFLDRLWEPNNSVNGCYTVFHNLTNSPSYTETYDRLGRIVLTRKLHTVGAFSGELSEYDTYGRLKRQSLPARTSDILQWTEYDYDDYDRIVMEKKPTGKIVQYSYNGSSVTILDGTHSVIKEYDDLGNLVSVTDSTGTIAYHRKADGSLNEIVMPNGVTSSFEYDIYGRLTKKSDPSYGIISYQYDDSGNLAKQTYANGKSIEYYYDTFNRLMEQSNDEFTATYSYDSKNRLINVVSDNGSSEAYAYDDYGNVVQLTEYAPTGKWLRQDFDYKNGELTSVAYTSNSGLLAKLDYKYKDNLISEIKCNNITISKITGEDAMFNQTSVESNGFTVLNGFTSTGYLSSKKFMIGGAASAYKSYRFNELTGNLESTLDNIHQNKTVFKYDNQNRLIQYGNNSIFYDEQGNILRKSDVGLYEYASDKPYAVIAIDSIVADIPTPCQSVAYTSFERPSSIIDDHYEAEILYNANHERVVMTKRRGNDYLRRCYMGGCYEVDDDGDSSTERLYLGGDYYDAPVVLIRKDGADSLYNIVRDHLGSIVSIRRSDGSIIEENNYDVWGRLLDPVTGKAYSTEEEPDLFLSRGYAGHEHLAGAGLINMNARLYDPLLGRFLSPDPYIGDCESRQNFNRYSYANNNPLSYYDKSGELPVWVIGAGVGAFLNLLAQHEQGNLHNWKDVLKAVGIGAIAGATGGYIGGAAFAAAGGYSGGFLAGAAGGIASSSVEMAILNTGNHYAFHEPWMPLEDYALGVTFAGITGGVINGYGAYKEGRNFWHGEIKPSSRKHVLSPYEKGQLGVERAMAEFNEEGGRVLGTEVTVEVNGIRTRVDFIGEKNGKLFLYEVKNGPHAHLTPNQKKAIPLLRDFRYGFIPIGRNAQKIPQLHHYTINKTTYSEDFVFILKHY